MLYVFGMMINCSEGSGATMVDIFEDSDLSSDTEMWP